MASKLHFLVAVGFLFMPGFSLPSSTRRFDFHGSTLSLADFALLETASLSKQKRNLNSDFKHVFLTQNGVISFQRNGIENQIEIAGSPKTSMAAVYQAASYVSKIVKHMPRDIFKRLASISSVGVFSADEKLTVYPEYAIFKNSNCGSSCTGVCSLTCATDGRKLEDLAGMGGRRAVVLDDNILCTPKDPYGHRENILAHEFAHTIHQYALSRDIQASILTAYLRAKRIKTWTLSSYAMSNHLEYFAEGAAVFFGVNVYEVNSGGMNKCGSSFCLTESSARDHLRNSDPALYNILSYVFTANHPELRSGLHLCPSQN